ncbi:FAD:protein FMN transferase [Arabiibacter massiliensis]|uniref:FAD:protein FMN transferase n=1 Tax=Arabiibacter massiliensis TaxID=1870985 RepID=UPI0009BC6056|nr:FAD:protein FMN transferase [Arabiibacter massiliensis]
MVSRDFFRFNTTNTLSADVDDERVLDAAVAWCDRCELLLSRVDPASELFRLNHAEGRPTEVDPELAAFIEVALAYCREAGGLFDVTMGSVTRLWDFKRQIVPDAADVAEALRHVDYRNVVVEGSTVTLRDPQACVDLGGIAKGYIADGLLALLRDHGVERALVNLGGNVAVMGGRPDGDPWRVGIRKPFPSSALPLLDSFATVALRDGSVVTSGVYERAFERDGALYHHILDPRTGRPAETDLLSATVVSRASLDADGFTTALVIMGADRALAFAEEHPALEAVLVTTEGDVLATSGIGKDVPFELLG